jgi:hypothetical protein
MVEDDDGAVLRGQGPECPIELISHFRRPTAIGSRWPGVGKTSQGEHVVPLTSRLRDAGTDDEPVCPGLETIRIAKLRQIQPDIDKRLLDRVFGPVGVSQDPTGDPVQAPG